MARQFAGQRSAERYASRRKRSRFRGLSHSHEPLRIVHLTDLHMSGRITRRYFERVVEETNALNADIVAITGDIVEREPCIDWIPETLGRFEPTAAFTTCWETTTGT